jgi:molybdopterin molybdotransferase
VSGLFTLVEPVAEALAGSLPRPVAVGSLIEDLPAGDQATRLVPVVAGRAARFADPAMLRGLAADAHLAVVPPGGVLAGQPVRLLTLP